MLGEKILSDNAIEAFVDHQKWPTSPILVQSILSTLYEEYLNIVRTKEFLTSVKLNRLSSAISRSEQQFSFSSRYDRQPTTKAIEVVKRQLAIALDINYTSPVETFIQESLNQKIYTETNESDPLIRCLRQLVHFELLTKPGISLNRERHSRGLIDPFWKP